MKLYQSSDFPARDFEILTEGLCFISNVKIRFLGEFDQLPESLARIETSHDDAWAAQAGVILDTPDCDLKGSVIDWKVSLQDVPENRHGKWL